MIRKNNVKIWNLIQTTHVGKKRLSKFMQNIGHETQIDILAELLSNNSGRKIATQVLQDKEIPEQAIMQLTVIKTLKECELIK
ncbi:hypothetical protein RclHR1_06710007 [Rhizophagus clarus]|uniref:Uncharacterized protein n=1 Tax=Rhizophagus clarus TaxID=94130 RepID=A0A2Z6SJC3_9GLOM|nr:hypothetical protein RclHR1_06710007 [Rhizophagus clarus]GES73180.1 hypothetical protein GLOIN_2v1846294 [Rhizophagus clarus]